MHYDVTERPPRASNYFQRGCFESVPFPPSVVTEKWLGLFLQQPKVARGDSCWLDIHREKWGENLSGCITNVYWSRNTHTHTSTIFFFLYIYFEWFICCIYICLMHFAWQAVKHLSWISFSKWLKTINLKVTSCDLIYIQTPKCLMAFLQTAMMTLMRLCGVAVTLVHHELNTQNN